MSLNAIGSNSPLLVSVAQVEVHGVAMPLVGRGFRNAYSTRTIQKSVVVRVVAVDGEVGLGNIDPSPGYSTDSVEESIAALRTKLAPALIGRDAANIHRLISTLDALVPGYIDAKAALEMAAVDLLTRHMGVSVHEWLGGAVVDRLSLNAWIGVVSPDEAAEQAQQWLKRGFRSCKIKVGGDFGADVDRVGAVRVAVGAAMQIRVDANAGYDVEGGIKLGRALERFDVQWLEQPVAARDLSGMAKVKRSVGIPIMADESITDHASLIEALRYDCMDIVKLKVMKQGGLLRCRRMVETAAAAGKRVVIGHGFGLGINTAAELMLAATSDAVVDGLECVGPLKTADDVVKSKFDFSRGSVEVPPGPGLGVELDEVKLEMYRLAEV